MTAPAAIAGSRRGDLAVAVPPPLFLTVSAPAGDESEALRLAEVYLTCAGTQVASRLLGCPDPGPDAVLTAELGDALLRGAALCAGLRDLADVEDRRPPL
ncbi:MAG: hypothetical protein U0031_22220 [Thermomicrobiales bacterium]